MYKLNIVTCMKVTGEAKQPQTFRQTDCYRIELWKALYKKAPTGQFLFWGKFLTERTLINESFPDFLRKNLSGKKTEQESNNVIFLLCLFIFIKIFGKNKIKGNLVFRSKYVKCEDPIP